MILKKHISGTNSKRIGLGEELLICIDEVLLKISINFQIYPKVNKNIRRIFIKKFPFCVFYIENEKSLIIFAVMHARKNQQIGKAAYNKAIYHRLIIHWQKLASE
ncbi:MAG: hypothetical protein ACC657_06230 [Thiohalomonadales bacterium]